MVLTTFRDRWDLSTVCRIFLFRHLLANSDVFVSPVSTIENTPPIRKTWYHPRRMCPPETTRIFLGFPIFPRLAVIIPRPLPERTFHWHLPLYNDRISMVITSNFMSSYQWLPTTMKKFTEKIIFAMKLTAMKLINHTNTIYISICHSTIINIRC